MGAIIVILIFSLFGTSLKASLSEYLSVKPGLILCSFLFYVSIYFYYLTATAWRENEKEFDFKIFDIVRSETNINNKYYEYFHLKNNKNEDHIDSAKYYIVNL